MMRLPTELKKRRDHWERLIPKLIDRRVYVVLGSELGIRASGDLAGFVSPSLHVLIREQLPDAYRGVLPGIVFVDEWPGMDAATLAAGFDAIVAHELAHVVESDLTSANCREDGGGELRSLLGKPHTEWPAHAGLIRWRGHDVKFIRCLCHVVHRLESRGLPVSHEAAFVHRAYGLSPLAKYRASLADELTRNSWRPLADVLREPLPAKTQTLWARDVSRSIKPLLKGATDGNAD